jgi:hypothetical protein
MSLIDKHFRQYAAYGDVLTPAARISRRRFLHAAALTAGGIVLADTAKLRADSRTYLSKEGSTEHFWYRPQPR